MIHLNFDTMAYSPALQEIKKNNDVANNLGLKTYHKKNLVTPDVSGLTNQKVLKAAFDAGVRNLVTDTSRAGYSNPSPNAGIYNAYQPDDSHDSAAPDQPVLQRVASRGMGRRIQLFLWRRREDTAPGGMGLQPHV